MCDNSCSVLQKNSYVVSGHISCACASTLLYTRAHTASQMSGTSVSPTGTRAVTPPALQRFHFTAIMFAGGPRFSPSDQKPREASGCTVPKALGMGPGAKWSNGEATVFTHVYSTRGFEGRERVQSWVEPLGVFSLPSGYRHSQERSGWPEYSPSYLVQPCSSEGIKA